MNHQSENMTSGQQAWGDSHCHLDFAEFKEPKKTIEALQQLGCEFVLVPGTQAQYFSRQIKLQKIEENMIKCAYGLHPFFLAEHEESHLIILEDTLQHNPCVAVGEIGLDYMLPEAGHDRQMVLFDGQVQLAKQYSLPLVLHCRKAHDQLSSHLKKTGFAQGGFIHGFSGSWQQAKRYLDLGFKLGLGGALTYDRANALKNLVKKLPDDSYVLETDSPDMRPAFARDVPNTPLNVPKIAQQIALIRGQSLEYVYSNSTENFYHVIHAK